MKSSKGSEFEREVCKQLSLWWTQDNDIPSDSVFWRTSQSGGRATERAKKDLTTPNSAGDVGCLDPVGQPLIDALLIELKRGYTQQISVLSFLDKLKGKPILSKWWDKAVKEKVESGRKYPMIIFKRDRHRKCILISINFFFEIKEWFGDFSHGNLRIKAGGYDLIVMELNHWLDWCNPNFFNRLGG